jgi:hypothetical protein
MRRLVALIALALALWIPSPTRATGYDFVVIATSQASAPFHPSLPLVPSIGNDGAVAFLATPRSSTEAAIFTGSRPGRRLADYTRVTPPGSPSVSEIGTSIGGAVAFAGSSVASFGVYRASLGVVTPILEGATGPIEPAVNASGALAYVEAGALRIADAQGSTTLIQKNDMIAGGTIFDIVDLPSPDISDSGQIAFYADIDFADPTCDEAFMRTTGLGADVIALGHDTACDFFSSGTVPLAINGLGHVGYAPELDDAIVGTVFTVFVDSSKIWDSRDPAFAPNLGVSDVALNDSGKVAFRVEGSGTAGVYTGSDPVSDKVLARGDPLCASTVTDVEFQRYGIDPLGRLALSVGLADGRRLIVRADPVLDSGGACNVVPEPGPIDAAAAAVAALLCAAGAAHRRAARGRAARA